MHYSVWGIQAGEILTSDVDPPLIPSSAVGVAVRPGVDLLVTHSPATVVGTPKQQAATLLHELGHNWNLDHGGNEERNHKPHYLSLMNYLYSDDGVPTAELGDPVLRFSYETLGPIVERNLLEKPPVPGVFGPVPGGQNVTPYAFLWICPDRKARSVGWDFQLSLDIGVNWNCTPLGPDQTVADLMSDGPVQSDVNGDGRKTRLDGSNDLTRIDLVFGDTTGFVAAKVPDTPDALLPEEMSAPERRRLRGEPDADRKRPRVTVTSGLVGAGGNPAVRLDLEDPAASDGSERSGLRAVEVEGDNVEPELRRYPELPPTWVESLEIESNDGAEPVFVAFVRDVAGNVTRVQVPPVVDETPPVCSLGAVDPASGAFEVWVSDAGEIAAALAIQRTNATATGSGGDSIETLLEYTKDDPALPAQVTLQVDDLAGNRSVCTVSPDDARDGDGDGVLDGLDVCPDVSDPGQADADGDGVGDACAGVDLPDLTGLGEAAADAALQTLGLRVGDLAFASRPEIPAGAVVAQRPAAGELAPQGAPVDLVLSTGAPQVEVPDLAGHDRAAALLAIEEAGLVAGSVIDAHDPAVPEGQVASQSPGAGANAEAGSPVDFVVSLGPLIVTVPSFLGLDPAAAEAAVLAAQLSFGGLIPVNSPTAPEGLIFFQNPLAGAEVVAGTSVQLAVSLGPVLTTVPGVVGQDRASAEAALAAASLFLSRITSVTDPAPQGQVIGQSLAAGSEVPVDSAIEITVSLGPAASFVDLPDLAGVAQAAAEAALVNAGLNVGTVTPVFSDTVAAGLVVDQSPPGGSSLATGSSVDLSVSRGPEFYPEFAIRKMAPPSVQGGSRFSYAIEFSHTGTSTVGDAVVTDFLQPSLAFVAASDGGTYSPGTRTVTWPVGTFAPGEAGARTLTVQATCTAGSVFNSARIVGGGVARQSFNAFTNITAAPPGPVQVEVETTPERSSAPPGRRHPLHDPRHQPPGHRPRERQHRAAGRRRQRIRDAGAGRWRHGGGARPGRPLLDLAWPAARAGHDHHRDPGAGGRVPRAHEADDPARRLPGLQHLQRRPGRGGPREPSRGAGAPPGGGLALGAWPAAGDRRRGPRRPERLRPAARAPRQPGDRGALHRQSE